MLAISGIIRSAASSACKRETLNAPMVQPIADLGRDAARIEGVVAWFGVLAVVAGVLVRITGLGAGSLAADEYYLVRSADNVAQTGWPAFACGGYYVRALLLQYP